jgi:hypothetical protein
MATRMIYSAAHKQHLCVEINDTAIQEVSKTGAEKAIKGPFRGDRK